jgi:hypothetical protein
MKPCRIAGVGPARGAAHRAGHPKSRHPAATAPAARASRAAGRKAKLKELSYG